VGAAVLKFGWRPTWGAIGWVLLIVVAPISWLLIRNQPEDRGLELDGISEPASKFTDLTTVEALRSSAFWIFALSSSLFGLVYSGISLFKRIDSGAARLQRIGLPRRSSDQHHARAAREFRRRLSCHQMAHPEAYRPRNGGTRCLARHVAAGPDLHPVLIYGAIMGIAGGSSPLYSSPSGDRFSDAPIWAAFKDGRK